jgi:hypothetical protein
MRKSLEPFRRDRGLGQGYPSNILFKINRMSANEMNGNGLNVFCRFYPRRIDI